MKFDDDLAGRVAAFRELSHGPRVLVLPNAWDAASARIFEHAGFPAIATTSAGIANSCGYADGQRIPRERMIEAVAEIARAVRIPVTADLEAGYGHPVETVQAALSAGAVGLNYEDMDADSGLLPIEHQVFGIRAMRSAAAAIGIPIWINARTDIYLHHIGESDSRFDRTIERAYAYVQAGADSIFVPGVTDEDTIGRLARAIPAPLNILAVRGSPPIARLEELGVRRVTIGSGAARAIMGLTLRIAEQLRDTGTYDCFTEGAMEYVAANNLFLK